MTNPPPFTVVAPKNFLLSQLSLGICFWEDLCSFVVVISVRLFNDSVSKTLILGALLFSVYPSLGHCFILLHVFHSSLSLEKNPKSLSQIIPLPSLKVCVSQLCRPVHLDLRHHKLNTGKKELIKPKPLSLGPPNDPLIFPV